MHVRDRKKDKEREENRNVVKYDTLIALCFKGWFSETPLRVSWQTSGMLTSGSVSL